MSDILLEITLPTPQGFGTRAFEQGGKPLDFESRKKIRTVNPSVPGRHNGVGEVGLCTRDLSSFPHYNSIRTDYTPPPVSLPRLKSLGRDDSTAQRWCH